MLAQVSGLGALADFTQFTHTPGAGLVTLLCKRLGYIVYDTATTYRVST